MKDTIDRARDPGRDALHAVRQRFFALRLDQQVNVIVLDGVVNDAKTDANPARGQGCPKRAHEPARAKSWNALANLDGNVHRAVTGYPFALSMQHPCAGAALAARAGPIATTAGLSEIERELGRTASHTWRCYGSRSVAEVQEARRFVRDCALTSEVSRTRDQQEARCEQPVVVEWAVSHQRRTSRNPVNLPSNDQL